jgi:hypothetical protein
MKNFIAILACLVLTVSCAKGQDPIEGTWKVKSEFYEATYELISFKGKIFGKLKYYNDGEQELREQKKKPSYVLTDLVPGKNGYSKGKLYGIDGKYYEINAVLKQEDLLEVKMTYQGKPYTEIWNRVKEEEKNNGK